MQVAIHCLSLGFSSKSSNTQPNPPPVFLIKKGVFVGDWCVFLNDDKQSTFPNCSSSVFLLNCEQLGGGWMFFSHPFKKHMRKSKLGIQSYPNSWGGHLKTYLTPTTTYSQRITSRDFVEEMSLLFCFPSLWEDLGGSPFSLHRVPLFFP